MTNFLHKANGTFAEGRWRDNQGNNDPCFRGNLSGTDLLLPGLAALGLLSADEAAKADPPVTVDYAMHLTPQGWKIYDVVVDGVSLVLTYRSEFAQVVRQSGIDGLLARLAEKNQPARP